MTKAIYVINKFYYYKIKKFNIIKKLALNYYSKQRYLILIFIINIDIKKNYLIDFFNLFFLFVS